MIDALDGLLQQQTYLYHLGLDLNYFIIIIIATD